jgi:glycosyltransferase involved in cell wall biosynthesis
MHVEAGRHLYGGAMQVFYLLRGLHERGVENLLVCPAGSAIAAAAAPFAQIRAVPLRGDLDVSFGWRLWRLVREERPDILHIHSRRGADLWGGLVAGLSGQTAILTRRVDNPEPACLARWKYRPYRHLVAISEGIRRVMLAQGVQEDRLTCVRSAIDIRPYAQAADREWFRGEFNLPKHAVAVGVIAQLIKRKGHRFLIEAAPGILQACPDARFLIFGKGPESGRLEALCRETGVFDAFRFTGFREDLAKILPNLQLVVHPALMEGLGIALLQACAAGVPIVAARAGGIPEVVRDDVNGVLVEPGDAAGLARAVSALLQDPDRRARLGRSGEALVAAEFSVEAMVDGNLSIYRTAGLSK